MVVHGEAATEAHLSSNAKPRGSTAQQLRCEVADGETGKRMKGR